MRAFPVAPLEVSARVSDLFTTVLARYGDLFVFRHTAGITESCLECILGSAEGEKQCARAQLSVNGYSPRHGQSVQRRTRRIRVAAATGSVNGDQEENVDPPTLNQPSRKATASREATPKAFARHGGQAERAA